jgi:ABC-type Fe3+/spermidine/putrescine transport system ATPase subunit
VVALVRPEDIQVQTTRPDSTDLNILPAVVETITFHGAVTRLGTNVAGQRVVADITVSLTEPVVLNQKIWLVFPPTACKVMATEE